MRVRLVIDFIYLKNLNYAVIVHFHKIFKGRASIPIIAETAEINRAILDAPSTRGKILLVKKLYDEGKTKSEIKCITNYSTQTITKYINMKEENISEVKKSCKGRTT